LSRPVTDQIAIDPSSVSPPWLSQIDQAWRILGQIDQLAVDVVGQDVILGGRVPSEQDRQVIASAVRTILAPANVVDRLEVVDWATKAKVLAEELTRRLGYQLTFVDSQADLTSASQILLQPVASALEANPRVRLGIGVHTDNRGTPESNRTLTQGRAERVRNYLVELGIAPERLVAIGFGDSRPIADNTSREGRAQNRRIEFFVPAGE
jgi:outer membrane protein OmpA-like peptidoglycan-associated protein